jgi:type I restriction enzyme R subunit
MSSELLTPPTLDDWKLAETVIDPQRLFVLWAIDVSFCTRIEDFKHHYGPELPIEELIHQLEINGFLQRDDADFVLTQSGIEAVSKLGETEKSKYAQLARTSARVERRFAFPTEATFVEAKFIEQLKGLGWKHITGDRHRPEVTERKSFREVILTDRVRAALRKINKGSKGEDWLDEQRIESAISDLERLGHPKLMEANKYFTEELLMRGVLVEGDEELHGGKDQFVRFIDLQNLKNNHFLVINQFRIDLPGSGRFAVPDIVLFVNGIPLVVVECKSPAKTNPVEEGITQLLRYSGQTEFEDGRESIERLFFYNQLLISTCLYEARYGAVGASYEHYLEWKDTSPLKQKELEKQLSVDSLSSQHKLVAGMLRRENILDIIRNFTIFDQSGGKTIKVLPRYYQYAAVNSAVHRLLHGQTKAQHGDNDGRGGIIWHTQGSGKSMTMVFLVRKMRTIKKLRRFKVVIVTDRIDLERQLSRTASLTGETVRRAKRVTQLKRWLREDGPDIIFTMIQKYRTNDKPDIEKKAPKMKPLGELNWSEDILIIVDEAHRSHTNTLHANLMDALPNAAKIGFTGTPIIVGDKKKSEEIFGPFIHRYTIKQSEIDGATVPLLYELRPTPSEVTEKIKLDQVFDHEFRYLPPRVQAEIKRRYATQDKVLEAKEMIEVKAKDILRHYVDKILPDGLKGQVVATSRRAAVRYQASLVKAREELIQEIEDYWDSWINNHHEFLGPLDFSFNGGENDDLLIQFANEQAAEIADSEGDFFLRISPYIKIIRRLEFAAVVSSLSDDPTSWNKWSDKSEVERNIDRFKRHLVSDDPSKQDPLVMLCVKNMLITGFDAPVDGVMYIDRRFTQEYELLQAIARVNRVYRNKAYGLVVDYFGLLHRLSEALSIYSAEDVQGVLISIKDELPLLADRHRRVLAVFEERRLSSITDVEACINLLSDIEIRADFLIKFKKFTASLDIVLPRPQGLAYVPDAKLLGFINKSAANLYRDSELNLVGVGEKVRELIDRHIKASSPQTAAGPVPITHEDFERTFESFRSDRTKASAMAHAARDHIRKHFDEDPARFKKLSEKLEEILGEFEGRWKENNNPALIAALLDFTRSLKQGQEFDETGLDPQTQRPFFGILEEELGEDIVEKDLAKMIELTVKLVEVIQSAIKLTEFWSSSYNREQLNNKIIRLLDNFDVPIKKLPEIADRIVELAERLHPRLVV